MAIAENRVATTTQCISTAQRMDIAAYDYFRPAHEISVQRIAISAQCIAISAQCIAISAQCIVISTLCIAISTRRTTFPQQNRNSLF